MPTTSRQPTSFCRALAEPLRHRRPGEIRADLTRWKAVGYTGVWLENDYVRPDDEPAPFGLFGKNWRLFDPFDFIAGPACSEYQSYLDGMFEECERAALSLYLSFWMPQLTARVFRYLSAQHPDALGQTTYWDGNIYPTICTCSDGAGLDFLTQTIAQFFRRFPKVAGLKVGTLDNSCFLCDAHCPNSRSEDLGDRLENLYRSIRNGMMQGGSNAELIVYPWFWDAEHAERVLHAAGPTVSVVHKIETGTTRQVPGEPKPEESLNDATILTNAMGPDFATWMRIAGPDRVWDMVQTGTCIEDFFLDAQPRPGTIRRRLRLLRDAGIRQFMDFECGGHGPGSNEVAVGVFFDQPDLEEHEFFDEVARRIYRNPSAQRFGVEGWRLFEAGFCALPLGLGDTGVRQFGGRFGMGWTQCIATPLFPAELRHDDGGLIPHWFSPYNTFLIPLAERLFRCLSIVLEKWEAAALAFEAACRHEACSDAALRESVACGAHVLAMRCALNWCRAGIAVGSAATSSAELRDVHDREVGLTEEFHGLWQQYPWIWDNACWNPHYTVLSQKIPGLGPHLQTPGADSFAIKRKLMGAQLMNA